MGKLDLAFLLPFVLPEKELVRPLKHQSPEDLNDELTSAPPTDCELVPLPVVGTSTSKLFKVPQGTSVASAQRGSSRVREIGEGEDQTWLVSMGKTPQDAEVSTRIQELNPHLFQEER